MNHQDVTIGLWVREIENELLKDVICKIPTFHLFSLMDFTVTFLLLIYIFISGKRDKKSILELPFPSSQFKAVRNGNGALDNAYRQDLSF